MAVVAAAIGLSFRTPPLSCCRRRRIFLCQSYGPFFIGGPDGDAGLTGEKSTPETLTTACHAASWLARSCKCGRRIDSIGPLNFLGAEAKNWPETSVPNAEAWIYRRAAVSGVWSMPGMSFAIGINSHFTAQPTLRTTLVSVAAPGDTAYTAMPEGSRRASAATHQAMMIFASEYVRLAWYFTFGPLRIRASIAAILSPWKCLAASAATSVKLNRGTSPRAGSAPAITIRASGLNRLARSNPIVS